MRISSPSTKTSRNSNWNKFLRFTRFLTSFYAPNRSPAIGGDGKQNDAALEGFLPLWRQSQKNQRGSDARQEQDAGKNTPEVASPARNGHTANDGGSNR